MATAPNVSTAGVTRALNELLSNVRRRLTEARALAEEIGSLEKEEANVVASLRALGTSAPAARRRTTARRTAAAGGGRKRRAATKRKSATKTKAAGAKRKSAAKTKAAGAKRKSAAKTRAVGAKRKSAAKTRAVGAKRKSAAKTKTAGAKRKSAAKTRPASRRASGRVARQDTSEREAQIIQALSKPKTISQIVSEMELSPQRVRQLLGEMRKSGQVRHAGSVPAPRGRPQRLYEAA